LTSRPFCRIGSGVRSRRQFRERDRGDGDFLGQPVDIDPFEVDDDRRIDEPA
jgi:hypothetical protein